MQGEIKCSRQQLFALFRRHLCSAGGARLRSHGKASPYEVRTATSEHVLGYSKHEAAHAPAGEQQRQPAAMVVLTCEGVKTHVPHVEPSYHVSCHTPHRRRQCGVLP